MGLCVCGGASLSCTFGMAPSVLNVLPTNRVMSSMPVATIMDYQPMMNVMPFGMCNNLSNPAVAAATSAAGTLTPVPCVPVITAPWTPGTPKVMIGSYPALNQDCKLMCMYGGLIEIKNPGQTTIMLP